MNTIASFLATAFGALAIGVARLSQAHDVDPYNDGYVTHVNDRQLEICFQHAPPLVGESVQILQTSYTTIKQGPSLQRFTRKGSARITSSGSDGCVSAELIDGSAARSDHTRSLAQGSGS